MAFAIHKYVLSGENPMKVFKIPKNSKILSIDSQSGRLCLWALVDLEEKQTVTRGFVAAPTGATMAEVENLAFLATVKSGPLVFHIFELV